MTVLSRPEAGEHVAACGLFCSNCGKFKSGRCQGCQVEPGFRSCPVRGCCAGRGLTSCAGCSDFAAPRDFRECGKLNSWLAKVFSFIFRSDRPGALTLLRDKGQAAYLECKRATGKM